MESNQAKKLTALLLGAYPAAKVSEATPGVYESYLADQDAVVALEAVRDLTRSAKFLPSIAELHARIGELSMGLGDSALAWESVLKAISKYGVYRSPEFDDAVTTAAVASVGWVCICNSPLIAVERAHFIKAYEAAKSRAIAHGSTEGLLEGVSRRGLRGIGEDDRRSSLPGSIKQIIAGVIEDD